MTTKCGPPRQRRGRVTRCGRLRGLPERSAAGGCTCGCAWRAATSAAATARRTATPPPTSTGRATRSIQSYEPGEDWWWCYVDEVAFLVEGAPTFSPPVAQSPAYPVASGSICSGASAVSSGAPAVTVVVVDTVGAYRLSGVVCHAAWDHPEGSFATGMGPPRCQSWDHLGIPQQPVGHTFDSHPTSTRRRVPMAYREVSVFEIKEVLRLWLRGEGYRGIDRLSGVDRKTVRRYVEAAVEVGLVADGGEEQLSDVVIGLVCERVRPARPAGHGAGVGVPRPPRGRDQGVAGQGPEAGQGAGPAGPQGRRRRLPRSRVRSCRRSRCRRSHHADARRRRRNARRPGVASGVPGKPGELDVGREPRPSGRTPGHRRVQPGARIRLPRLRRLRSAAFDDCGRHQAGPAPAPRRNAHARVPRRSRRGVPLGHHRAGHDQDHGEELLRRGRFQGGPGGGGRDCGHADSRALPSSASGREPPPESPRGSRRGRWRFQPRSSRGDWDGLQPARPSHRCSTRSCSSRS